MDIAMDPRVIASMARHRLRGAVVQRVARAGSVPEVEMLAGLQRLRDVAKVPQTEIDWVMRSLARDGLVLLEAGVYQLGPAALAWLNEWASQKAAAVAPQEKTA